MQPSNLKVSVKFQLLGIINLHLFQVYGHYHQYNNYYASFVH